MQTAFVRLLHTADWHLGLRLYKKEISEEHRYFFAWLRDLIKERKIDVLLISGDIFDHANPSNDTRRLYYEFLKALIDLKIRVIITGGNHDSPGILNAPREILEMLDVHIIGSIPEDSKTQVIPLNAENGELVTVVCAIPYLREPDIHALTLDAEYEDKRQQVRDAIRKHYNQVAEFCVDYKVPVIAMGHLYAAGTSTSDSERLIQMGNQSPVAANDFPSLFSYVALGHIHKPQRVAQLDHIRYSGSPVPLSFSEREDKKIVIELEIRDGEIIQRDHPVPGFRKLIRFKGSLEEVTSQAREYRDKGVVKSFGELHIEELSMNPGIYADAARLVGDWNSEFIDIVNYTITNSSDTPRMQEMANGTLDLKEIKPIDVLNKMMEAGNVKLEDQESMRLAFMELLDMDDEMEEE